MISKIICGCIVILVGCNLLPEVARQVKSSSYYYTDKKGFRKQTYEEYVQERLNVERIMK